MDEDEQPRPIGKERWFVEARPPALATPAPYRQVSPSRIVDLGERDPAPDPLKQLQLHGGGGHGEALEATPGAVDQELQAAIQALPVDRGSSGRKRDEGGIRQREDGVHRAIDKPHTLTTSGVAKM